MTAKQDWIDTFIDYVRSNTAVKVGEEYLEEQAQRSARVMCDAYGMDTDDWEDAEKLGQELISDILFEENYFREGYEV